MADSLPTPAAPVSKAGTLRLVTGKGGPACFARVRVLRLVELRGRDRIRRAAAMAAGAFRS